MMASGRCQTYVAESVGIEQSKVSRLWQLYILKGNASKYPVEGRPSITPQSDERSVALTARRKQTMPERTIAAELNDTGGALVSATNFIQTT